MARLLAFINIFVQSPHLVDVVQALSELPNVEELYKVTGEFDIAALVSTADIEEFRDFLNNKILMTKGVRGTTTSIVLHAVKGPKNGAQATTSKSTQSQ